jgi:CheY-like chemotaxis protein
MVMSMTGTQHSPFRAAILVVDDQPLVSMLLDEYLSELGCQTVGPAESVPVALGLIEKTPAVDGAILDVTLGDGESYPVAEVLHARGVPFAFATGYDGADITARFKNAPVLRKPFDFDEVKRVVEVLLASQARTD